VLYIGKIVILVAPHGIFEGLFGVAAQVHLGAAAPQNYIAFEYAKGQPEWWYDIVEGLPDPIVKNGFIEDRLSRQPVFRPSARAFR
jgi:L-alanine-DL-glutamate epimerase-like enolase superfamily enzyme